MKRLLFALLLLPLLAFGQTNRYNILDQQATAGTATTALTAGTATIALTSLAGTATVAGTATYATNAGNAVTAGSSGTWSPVLNSWTNVGSPTLVATYTKIGRLVYINLDIKAATTVAAVRGTSYVSGLPFLPAAGSFATVQWGDLSDAGDTYTVQTVDLGGTGVLFTPTLGPTGNETIMNATYMVP